MDDNANLLSEAEQDDSFGRQQQQQTTRSSRWREFVSGNAILLGTIAGALFGVVIGVSVGQASPSPAVVKWIQLPGQLFVRVLKFLVVPLLMTSVISGVAALGAAGAHNGRALAVRTTAYFFLTMVVAVLTGLVLVTAIHPGSSSIVDGGSDNSTARPTTAASLSATADASDAAIAMITSLFPDNIAGAIVRMDMLGLITFSIAFAAAASTTGEDGRALLELVQRINVVFMKLVHWVMFATPLGVCSLLAGRLASSGTAFWSIVSSLGLYMATVIVGLSIHGFISLPLLQFAHTRGNPYKYMAGVSQALLTAFGTASSSATLPVTLQQGMRNGLSETVARFVLPLGSTINMDGTALYEAVAAVFIAQSYGMSLTFADNIAIAFAAVLASVGAAGIPEAGLVTMVLVLNAANLPVEGIALLLPVDWLLDRCRTTLNVFGDLVVAIIVEKQLGGGHQPPPEDLQMDEICNSQT